MMTRQRCREQCRRRLVDGAQRKYRAANISLIPACRLSAAGLKAERQEPVIVILFETFLLVLAAGLALVLDINLFGRIVVTPQAVMLGVAAAILPNLVLAPAALRSQALWAVNLRERTAAMLRRVFGNRPGPVAALAVGYGGIAEEALFRGVLIPALSPYVSPWGAVIIVGAGFGLLHPLTRLYVVLAALLGIFWGALYVWTGNLLVPMIAHALNNIIAMAWYSRTAES